MVSLKVTQRCPSGGATDDAVGCIPVKLYLQQEATSGK